MMRRLYCVALFGALASLAGCTELQEYTISARNRCWSHTAWHGSKADYRPLGMSHHVFKHYGRGWRAGYYAVAQSGGEGGNVPLFPPRRYWGVHFMNPMGHDEIEAWFHGFQEGSTAAEADGVGYWSTIPDSRGMSAKTEVVGPQGYIPPGYMPPTEEVRPGHRLDGIPPVPTEELPPTQPKTPNSQVGWWFFKKS